MAVGRRRRQAILVATLSSGVHLVLLALMIRAVPPPRIPMPTDDARAIQVTLQPRPSPPKTTPAQPPPSPLQRELAPPPPRPLHTAPVSPQTPAPTPVAPLPAPATPPGPAGAPKTDPSADAWARLGQAIRGRTGCSNPDAAGLNAAERAACADRLAQSLARAPTLPLGLPSRKLAEFDRGEACRDKYERGTMPPGTLESDGVSRIHGLGYIPKASECRPTGH